MWELLRHRKERRVRKTLKQMVLITGGWMALLVVVSLAHSAQASLVLP